MPIFPYNALLLVFPFAAISVVIIRKATIPAGTLWEAFLVSSAYGLPYKQGDWNCGRTRKKKETSCKVHHMVIRSFFISTSPPVYNSSGALVLSGCTNRNRGWIERTLAPSLIERSDVQDSNISWFLCPTEVGSWLLISCALRKKPDIPGVQHTAVPRVQVSTALHTLYTARG